MSYKVRIKLDLDSSMRAEINCLFLDLGFAYDHETAGFGSVGGEYILIDLSDNTYWTSIDLSNTTMVAYASVYPLELMSELRSRVEKTTNKEKTRTCDMQDLMTAGCNCGAIERFVPRGQY